ncbi:MAG: hypothetical protein IJ829_06715, partial [Kiritimatiellae bacterium]|nr:hypothetical protein [Kiritimatiellia bacterium]
LALIGPVEGLRLANHAAKKNGMTVRDEFAEILRDHVADIRTVYMGGTNDKGEPYPEPYPGAWGEYAAAIEGVIAEGLACGPDNVEFYGAQGGHYLLMKEFYQAVAGENWCWFHWHAKGLLDSYADYHDWAPLPTRDEESMENSEIFSLHLKAWTGALLDLLTTNELQHVCKTYGDGELTQDQLASPSVLTNRDQTWFLFDGAGGAGGVWGRWFDGLALAGDEEGYDFPIVGEIKPEYNVRGCAAICRCVNDVETFAVEATSAVTWAAAAKPFGSATGLDGEADVATALKAFVVPCFTHVRLVPLDSVGGEDLSTADYGWVTHVRKHLPDYLAQGPAGAHGCFYCQQLQTWEHTTFRESGKIWLRFNSGTCVRPTGGGGGGHGGTSHGH